MSAASAPSDEMLVQRAKQGDRAALVTLYNRYVNEIYGYVLNQLGSVQNAEDVTSEVFLRLVGQLPGFRGQASFRTWLYAIARNQVRDHWRLTGRRPHTVELDQARTPAVPAPAAEPPPGGATTLGRRVMAQLPENYRRVLQLRILDGRSIRDTADELGTSVANAKVLQHRALKRAARIAETLAEGNDDLPTD